MGDSFHCLLYPLKSAGSKLEVFPARVSVLPSVSVLLPTHACLEGLSGIFPAPGILLQQGTAGVCAGSFLAGLPEQMSVGSVPWFLQLR